MKSRIELNKSDSLTIYKPERCPFCGNGIDAKVLNYFFHNGSYGVVLYVALQCPVCGDIFFCSYSVGTYVEAIRSEYPFNFSEIIGGGIKEHFSKEINEISPSFVKIYNEAYLAEQKGLHEIDGMGYRKAFEFLIKDFSIKMEPEEKDAIANKTLSECISYVFSENEKGIFEKTGWIGNDQTHYVRKHENFNVSDLKKMIMICVSKIETKIREIKYLEEIEK